MMFDRLVNSVVDGGKTNESCIAILPWFLDEIHILSIVLLLKHNSELNFMHLLVLKILVKEYLLQLVVVEVLLFIQLLQEHKKHNKLNIIVASCHCLMEINL